MMKRPADSNGENRASVESMFEGRDEKGIGLQIPECEEEAAEQREHEGEGIAENNVHVSKCNRAGEYDRPAGAEEIAIALEQESAKYDSLRINGEHRISDHYEAPKRRVPARKIEEEIRPEAKDECDPDRDRECKQSQYCEEVLTQRRRVPKALAWKERVTKQHEETPGSQYPQRRDSGNPMACEGK